jgi:hypothetical protein
VHWFIRLWPVAGLGPVAMVSGGFAAVVLLGFFVVIALWPGVLLVERLAGSRAAFVSAAACTALLLAQAVLPAPQLAREPVWLSRSFDSERQIARHSMALPTDDARWSALWARSPQPEAFLYVALALAEGVDDPALQIRLGGRTLGELDRNAALKGGSPWYRLRVARSELQGQPPLEVTIAPRPGTLAPGAVRLHGGFSSRSTVVPRPSAFFDGERWLSEPDALLPGYASQGAGPARYYVELRLIDPTTRRVLTVYY